MNTREIASFIVGICSSLIWFIAKIPQIKQNYQTKSVEGIALSMFILMFVGDILNLISIILTKGELSQYIVSAIFIVVDIILTTQILMYSCKNEEQEENSLEEINIPKILPLTALAQMVNAIETEQIYKENLTGIIFSWISVLIYASSRIEQLIKNFKNKSVKNLSVWFSLGMIGNVLYIVSILIISVEKQYLYNKLSWILSAGIPLICDVVIFIQRYIY
jgi:uncharacterized protein with PQ loop repeat